MAPKCINDTHCDEPPGPRILVRRNSLHLEAQTSERAGSRDLVLISIDFWISDDTNFGPIESESGEADRRGDVNAFWILDRRVSRIPAEDRDRFGQGFGVVPK